MSGWAEGGRVAVVLRVVFFSCLGLAIAGCKTSPPKVNPVEVEFDSGAARSALSEGRNTLVGKVLMHLSTGAALTCAGGTVRLIPATAYADEWVERMYRSDPADVALSPQDGYYLPSSKRAVMPEIEPRFMSMTRDVPCDHDGQFRIDRIQDGDFYLEAKLIWQKNVWDELSFYNGKSYRFREGTVIRRLHLSGGRQLFLDLRWQVQNSRYSGLLD